MNNIQSQTTSLSEQDKKYNSVVAESQRLINLKLDDVQRNRKKLVSLLRTPAVRK